jgi:glycosyltransferase involved in cell wall biosynthesis
MINEKRPLKVLMITKEWPTRDLPGRAPYIAQQHRFVSALGVEVDFFTFPGDKNPLNYLRAWLEVRRRLWTRGYDLVHGQFGQSAMMALPKQTPLVVTFRGSDLEGIVGRDGRYTLAGRVLRALSRFVARTAEEVIVVSESLGQRLPPGTSYTVIPSGLNLEIFRPIPRDEARRELGLPAHRRLVLFGGDPWVPRKRHPLAERAVGLLNGGHDAQLLVADRVPHERMGLYMNAADVLLLTSMHEGSPNVVKEALACNVPVVSVNVGDVAQRLAGLEGAVVCEDDRPETIARALDRVLSRHEPFEGRSRVLELDENLLARRVIEVYRRALEAWRR